jgi:UDP-glucose 4-epimerase
VKVLVTGGFGFIGSHIIDVLLAENHYVIAIDNFVAGKLENVKTPVAYYNLDISEKSLEQVFMNERPEYVIHHAAQVCVSQSLANPMADVRTNVMGTIQLLALSVKYNVKKFIFASSCAVYGSAEQIPVHEDDPLQPLSVYGCSKYSAEQYIQSFSRIYGLSYIIFRYANVYGPRQSTDGEGGVICTFIERLLNGRPNIIYGDGNQTRDFVYVKDVALANLLALNQGENKTINIGSGEQKSINELYQTLSSILADNGGVRYLPGRQGDIKESCLNNKKAEQVLGWKPRTSFEKGLIETIQYYKLKQDQSKEPVTVVITTYNAGIFLKEAVQSVFKQSYAFWKLIIIDDASTDESINSIHDELLDPRVQLIVNPQNVGQTESLNIALSWVTTSFMIQLDSDDWLDPDTLKVLAEEAEHIQEDVAVIGGNIKLLWVDRQGMILKSSIRKGRNYSDPYTFMLANKSIWPRFYRTSALRAVGGWPTDGPYEGRYIEDLRILFRLIDKYRFHWIDRILYIHRRHQHNMTLKIKEMKQTLLWLIESTLEQWGGEYKPEYKVSSSGYPKLVALVPCKTGKKRLLPVKELPE